MTDNRRMRTLSAVLAVALLVVAPAAAQSSLTGEWAIAFVSPNGGQDDYTLYLTQEGPRLSGHLTSQYGEIPVKGTVNGDDVKLTWTTVENRKPIELSVTAKVKGESMTGTIRIGDVGQGPFSAERTSS
jgi:hypothetical protein